MGLEIDREFEFYLVAHEFKIPGGVEAVKKWPITVFMKYNMYLAQYYKVMSGGQGIKLPTGMGNISDGAKKKLQSYHFK